MQLLAVFWNVALHTLFALDGYLSGNEAFAPPSPFSAEDIGPQTLPRPVFTKKELLVYVAYCEGRARDVFASLTDEEAARPRAGKPFASSLIRNLMHLCEHTAQLDLFIGSHTTRTEPALTIEIRAGGDLAAYDPVPAQVWVGEVVEWRNQDVVARSVEADGGRFSSGPIPAGGSWWHVFTEDGTFAYRDGTRDAVAATIEVRR